MRIKCSIESWSTTEAARVRIDPRNRHYAMTSDVDPATIAAYAATHYAVHGIEPGFVLRADQPSAELKALHAQTRVACSAFMTAWNPGSRRRANEINEAAQSELEATLRAAGFPLFGGVAVDPTGDWPEEPSVLVLGIHREHAAQLGRHYGQNAISDRRRRGSRGGIAHVGLRPRSSAFRRNRRMPSSQRSMSSPLRRTYSSTSGCGST